MRTVRRNVGIAEGRAFGPYIVDQELGSGGMATVWRAHHQDDPDGTPVVLKTMLPHIAKQPQFVAMFVREAVLGAELSHPNLVEVFDVGMIDQQYFIEMEFVAGRTIRHVLRRAFKLRRALPVPFALAVMSDCCDALAYIHDYRDVAGRSLRLVHRDISPENLMISDAGVTKLLDFGIATAAQSMLTVAGERKGKMHYMPPEVFRSAPADTSRDIYAVGATLYELVAGRRPFTGKNDAELMFQIAEAPLLAARRVRPDLPVELDRLITSALARDPKDRCVDAAELGHGLRETLAQLDTRAPSEIVADTLQRLFSGAIDDDDDDQDEEITLATLDHDEIVLVEAPAAVKRGSEPDLFSQAPYVRSTVSEDVVSDIFTNSSASRRRFDETTSSVFALYESTRRKDRGSDAPVPELRVAKLEDVGGATVEEEGAEELNETRQHALVHFELGLEHKRSGRLTSALAEWELAAELDPDNRTIATNVRLLKRKME